jgi:hypothetical protein
MAYVVAAFDGIQLPTYNPVHNMGTGAAVTAFQQLPDGTYYDHFTTSISPQGIRPIRVKGMIYDTTAAAMKTAIDNLRKKLGTRGKLTIQFDDGSMRWQWARLVDVDIPSEYLRGRLNVDFELTFITASQIWYGVVTTSEEWSWGDLSWTFGDGTAELGESGVSTTLTATGATISGLDVTVAGTQQVISLTNNGNKPATNLVISITGGTSTIHAVNWANPGSNLDWSFEADVTTSTILKVDCGAMNVTNNASNAYTDFTAFNRSKWEELTTGANSITVSVDGNENQDATIVVEYYDHYF